jgi:hypothetical protein
VANYDTIYHVQITDVNGDSATVSLRQNLADTSTIVAIKALADALTAAIAACTNGKVTSESYTVLLNKAQISSGTAPPPASSVYPSVTDGAKLSFSGASGESRSITIPAPLLSDFLTGTNTVNPGDANISALIAQVEGMNDEGLTVNLYEGGVKVGRHSRRRPARKHL